MPCEACNVQFTVFRRKKSCMECRRLYCNQCLVKRRDRALCERCVVFTTRPLSKIELLKLKPKDLIFFLQSKHISTTGCVEKEELVNLVLIHVNNSVDVPPAADETFGNPFDQIKHTCQNLFTSFTDKIATDLNFDNKSSTNASSRTTPTTPPSSQNIFSQPRASRRPSASFSSSSGGGGGPAATASATARANVNVHGAGAGGGGGGGGNGVATASSSSARPSPTSPNHPNGSSSAASPTFSSSASSSISHHVNYGHPNVVVASPEPPKRKRLADMTAARVRAASCECDDNDDDDEDGDGGDDGVDDAHVDDVINEFRRSQSQHSADLLGPIAGPSGPQQQNLPASHDAAQVKPLVNAPTTQPDSDDASSFEELAGVPPANATTASVSDTDNWQMVEHASEACEVGVGAQSQQQLPQAEDPVETDVLVSDRSAGDPQPPLTPRRVNRRRSESALLAAGRSSRRHFSIEVDEDADDDAGEAGHQNDNQSHNYRHTSAAATTAAAQRPPCDRCGKRKANIRRLVTRFKRQLESRHTGETEMRRELSAFLAYLEQTQLGVSQDGADEEADQSRADSDAAGASGASGFSAGGQQPADADDDDFSFGEDDGIHVYGTDDPMNGGGGQARQFINLTDIQESSDLDELTVKQLKEILMLNRVDFKGCCEKTELLDRVKRLWNECSTCPAVDKLPTDDLCKICMDAPIECVILECGHMATCTACGKVLSECPICRQYIVRVVRFFRA